MLDEVKALVKEIGDTPGRYLVSCFFLNNQWRVDYYSQKEHKIYTYYRKDNILQTQKDDVFQKEQRPLEKLDLNRAKVHYLEALEKVPVSGNQCIVILQVIDGRVVWNITIFTPEFRVYNLKVDAETGKKISETEEKLLDPSTKLGFDTRRTAG